MIQAWSLYDNKKTNITPLLKSIEWSGDKSQVARKLAIKNIYSIYDTNQPKIELAPGALVWLVDEAGKEFYRGIIFDRDISSTQELGFTAYDFLIYFLKSKASYNFTNALPEDIARTMCNEAGVEAGNIASTGVRVNIVAQGTSLYDIIMKAYTQASKQTGKQYIPKMDGTKLSVIEKGASIVDYPLDPNTNLISTSINETIDGMVNRVKVYDDKNNFTGQVIENTDWVKKYGVLQEAYTKEEDTNPTTAAQNMLHGLDISTDVEILGNLNCITGTAIRTKIPYISSLNDKVWYVDGDVHSWEVATNKYTMKLNLSNVNEMDEKE